MGGSIRRRGEESFEVSVDLGRDSDGRRLRRYFTVKGTKEKAKERLDEVVEAYNNAEWEAKLEEIRQEVWGQNVSVKTATPMRAPQYPAVVDKKYVSSGGPGFYRSLPPDEKMIYHGRGAVYTTPANKLAKHPKYGLNIHSYRMEWASGERSSINGKVKYRSLTVWGTYDDARSLLDMIVAVPYRSVAEAEEVIRPYFDWEGEGPRKAQNKKRRIRCPIPKMTYLTPPEMKRQRILLDYWRLRTIDTIREYMRLGDD